MADPDLDCDLRKLSPEDLRRVRLWVEDRLINAVTPLDIRLQMQMPGTMAADVVYQEARRTVDRIVELVDEVRRLAQKPDRKSPLGDLGALAVKRLAKGG